jgi:hypothetical protein
MNPLKKILGKRKQLFEIQDFDWCPKAVRDGVTDLLVLNLKIVPLYDPAITWLVDMQKASGTNWIDLCAGAGGGSLPLHEKLEQVTLKKVELIITDLYPHDDYLKKERITFYPQSVNAKNVPHSLKGFRTLFTSLHHLTDETARAVLKDAFDNDVAIGAFEFTERSLFCLLMTLPTFFFTFFLVPFIFPWKFSRLFWTYFIPLIPLVATIDIILSAFRTRSPEELNSLIQGLQKKEFEWKVGRVPSYLGFSMTYIVGLPLSRQ